jgi:hypothetical protein
VSESKKIQYCKDCGRIEGIGCACNLSFAEKMKTVALTLPGSFRAVK